MSKRKKKILKVMLLSVYIIFMFSCTVSAAPLFEGYGEQLKRFYKILLGIAIPVAALGLGMSGYIMLTGGEDGMKKGIKYIRNTIIALICLFVIPLLIEFTLQTMNGKAWNPESHTPIIENAITNTDIPAAPNFN